MWLLIEKFDEDDSFTFKQSFQKFVTSSLFGCYDIFFSNMNFKIILIAMNFNYSFEHFKFLMNLFLDGEIDFKEFSEKTKEI